MFHAAITKATAIPAAPSIIINKKKYANPTVSTCFLLLHSIRENRTRSKREVTFSDLSPQEENQLYTCDKYFVNDEAEKSFFVAGREITAKQLADALHSLPEEKRQAVLLYYFFDMTDVEIAELMKIPRSTVQFRRTSSFELLKRFLEEKADEWN